MNNKQKYREFCRIEKNIPIFSKDWWLDAVAGEDNWNVAIVEKNNEIIASFPYVLKQILFFRLISMPRFTPMLGVYIKYPENQSYYDKLSYEKKVISDLIDQLPNFHRFHQKFHYSFTNWLPFYWRGFSQTTRYTYVIEDISDYEMVVKNFEYSKRKNIKRAKKIVTIKFDLTAKEFYENHKMTLAKQGQKINYDFNLFKRIYDAAYAHNAGRTIYCVDKNNNIHSGLFVVWDDNSAFDLISTIDPDYRNSGSASLLIQEIIKYLSNKTKRFDFEGSMIEEVERSFRRFGAKQKQYFSIYKRNFIFKLIECLIN